MVEVGRGLLLDESGEVEHLLAGDVHLLNRNAAVPKTKHEVADQLLYVVLHRIILVASQMPVDFADEPNWKAITAYDSFLHSQILDDRQLRQLEVDHLNWKLMLLDAQEDLLAALHSFKERLTLLPRFGLEHKRIVCYPKMFPHELSQFLLNFLLLQEEATLPSLENEVFGKMRFGVGSFLRVG